MSGGLDIGGLLEEVSPEAPSGENLEYDPAFVELVRLAQGKAEQQMGDAVVAGEEPDWRAVRGGALELLARTRDLRLAVYLTRALLRTDGIPGLSDGLALTHGLIDRYWETVHPQLDPDDDNDPTMRVNTLVALRDEDALLRALRETPLVASRAVGRFSLKDVLVAAGQLPAPTGGDPPPDTTTIDAAVMDTDLESLQATGAALTRARELAGAVEVTLTEKVGVGHAADFSELSSVLKQAGKVVNEWLLRRGVGVETADDEAAGPEGRGERSMSGAISSREDVVRVLDRVCAYFAQHEPSSPVPLLLKRAKRLVSKDFLEILRDLAPDGVAQAEAIRGPDAEGS
jgi:type VI secretion system protein ImpA